jgi:hypothetical protein
MMSFRDDLIINDQNRSNGRIWAGPAERLLCLL